MMGVILAVVLGKSIYDSYVYGGRSSVNKRESSDGMSLIPNPGDRLWRTDLRLGRNMYALLSNDLHKPSPNDPLVGTMETSELAEIVVEVHNKMLVKYGRHYLRMLEINE